MRNSKAKHSSDWRDGFLFLGNQPALDFVNTRPVQDEEAVELLPDFSAILRWFSAAGLIAGHDARTMERRWGNTVQARQTVRQLRELRERLRAEILFWETGRNVHPSIVSELNDLMADHPMKTRVRAEGDGFVTELYFEPSQPSDLLAPLAYWSGQLLANADPKRMRKCSRCILHFLDVSKKGTRRWCSMQLCGNREKVASYAARERLERN